MSLLLSSFYLLKDLKHQKEFLIEPSQDSHHYFILDKQSRLRLSQFEQVPTGFASKEAWICSTFDDDFDTKLAPLIVVQLSLIAQAVSESIY